MNIGQGIPAAGWPKAPVTAGWSPIPTDCNGRVGRVIRVEWAGREQVATVTSEAYMGTNWLGPTVLYLPDSDEFVSVELVPDASDASRPSDGEGA